MCTLAQILTHITNTIINNKPMNNNTHSNNKVTVMTSLINVLFNSNNPSYQADNEVDAMSNKIQYSNDYDVDLYIKGDYGYSTDTEEQQIADMQWAFEAEIDALYGEHDDEVSLSDASVAMILAYAKEGAAKERANSANEEDPMCEGKDMSDEDMEALFETIKGLDETEEDDMSNDKDNNMFSIMPVLALAADTTYATMTGNEKIMMFSLLVFIPAAVIAAIVASIWYEKKQKADKLAIAERWLAHQQEQMARANAIQQQQFREHEIARQRQMAEQAAHAAQLVREQQEAQIKALQDNANLGCKEAWEKLQFALFIKEISEMKNNDDLWKKLDMEIEEEITWEAVMKASQDLDNHADYSFFYKNASIQGIRSFMLMAANLNEWDASNMGNNSIYQLFRRFTGAIEKTLKGNDYQYYELTNSANWCHAVASTRILTKTEWEAAKLLLQKRHPVFFANWYFPLNDAALGGLLLAMSKDPAFADEMYAISQDHNFWRSKEMTNEKSLWKAAQWKTYLARYNKVKELKEDLMPIFARVEVATCKLTTDIVVGFKFGKKEFKSCDVADTDQIEKILAAGYDQVLRIRRTDAAGIWNESKQINSKYTGNFCTGYGMTQDQGYYQSTFLNGTNIPWVADIQINGEWHNFGVVLTNSIGVVDFGMGNDNRSKKHRSVLHDMFGNGENGTATLTPGQNEAMDIYYRWFIQREFNINHVVAQIKAKLAAAVNNDVW